MNVEFLVHGTLTGQAYWKETDKDYCSRAYAPRPENVVLESEIVRRNDGRICSYYNYLRYNNIVSSRTGAYFGMTVRVDDMICCDMGNMYHLLDTLFNKCVVGTLLKANNGSYNYTFDNFQSKDSDLKGIESKFANMFSALFVSGNDFAQIPSVWSRKSGVVNLHIDDVSKTVVRDTMFDGRKLCVSPYFPTKQSQNTSNQIQNIKNEAEQKIKTVKEDCERKIKELEQANNAAFSKKEQLNNEINSLKEQLQNKEDELENVKVEFRKQKLNAEINQTAKDLKEPIIKLAGLMAERFSEVGDLDHKAGHKHGKKNHSNSQSSFFPVSRKSIVTIVTVLVLAVVAAWTVTSLLEEKDKQIAELKATLETIQNPPSEVQPRVPDDEDVESEYEKTYDLATLKIDIVGYNGKDEGLKTNMSYKFRIAGGEYPENGFWIVNNIKIEGDEYYVADEAGTVLSIEYTTTTGETVGPRTIKVIQ